MGEEVKDEASAIQARKIQTTIYVARGEIEKAPNRSDALLTLKHFISAVEERDEDKVKLYEAELDGAAGAISDAELNFALETLFSKDQSAVAFLESRGWELSSYKKPTQMFQYPNKGFYLTSIAGGMNFGPQFRSNHPWKIGLSTGVGKERPRTLSVLQLPDTEAWQGRLCYRHGIIDGGIQSQGVAFMAP